MTSMRQMHDWLSGISGFLSRIVGWVVLAILIYLIVAVNATIVLRAGFGISLPWIMDSAQLVIPLLAFFAAAVAFSSDSHPRMEFILNKLPPHLTFYVSVFIHVLTVILMAVFCYFSWGYAQLGKAITITSMDFLTAYPFYLSLPIGFGCITIICLERLFYILAYRQSLPKKGDF